MDTIPIDTAAAARLGALSLALTSSQGNSRKENMDLADWFPHPSGATTCLVLADGMGGPGGGKEASRLAVAEVGRVFAGWPDDDWERCLKMGILSAAERIAKHAQNDAALDDMGTTVVAVVIAGDRLVVAHVGDSRAVLFRGDCVGRLTKDHLAIVEDGLLDEMGRRVFIEENRAKKHPKSNILSRSVGGGDPLRPEDIDVGGGVLQEGDLVMLCSDGVTEYVLEDFVVGLIAQGTDAAEMARAIVERAVRQGSHDHSTALVARVEAV